MFIYEDGVGFVIVTLYVDDLLLLGANKLLFNTLKKQLMDRFERTGMEDVSRVLGMNVARDCKKGTIIINERDYTEDVIERFSMKGCNPAYTSGVGSEHQPEEKSLTRRTKSVTSESRMLSCTLGRFPATSPLPLTSWQGHCPSLQKPTWERPST